MKYLNYARRYTISKHRCFYQTLLWMVSKGCWEKKARRNEDIDTRCLHIYIISTFFRSTFFVAMMITERVIHSDRFHVLNFRRKTNTPWPPKTNIPWPPGWSWWKSGADTRSTQRRGTGCMQHHQTTQKHNPRKNKNMTTTGVKATACSAANTNELQWTRRRHRCFVISSSCCSRYD